MVNFSNEEMNMFDLNNRVKIIKKLNEIIEDIGCGDNDGYKLWHSYENSPDIDTSDEDYMEIAKNEIEFLYMLRFGLDIIDYCVHS